MTGFSLIELMITLSICAIIAMMAYPSYVHYQADTNRSQAEISLVTISGLMEQYNGAFGTYLGATLQKIHWVNHNSRLPYQFKIAELSDQHYLLQAIPLSSQIFRDVCGTLGLTETNEQLISGSVGIRDCW